MTKKTYFCKISWNKDSTGVVRSHDNCIVELDTGKHDIVRDVYIAYDPEYPLSCFTVDFMIEVPA